MTDKTKIWIKAAGIRAVKTVAQSAIGLIGTSTVIADIDWKVVVSASLLAGFVSILTSVATGLPEVTDKEKIIELENKE